MDTNPLNTPTALPEVTKEQLINDFKVVIADAEAILKASASQSGEQLAALRVKATESLAAAKEKLAEAQVLAKQKGLIAAAATDRYVHESPWVAVGVAAGLGLVVGALLNRR
jgi:ElaB/YqjD/DUF883 family membrane-anchored ribosome-binding protein